MKSMTTLALTAATILATHSAAQAYFVPGSRGIMINCPSTANVTLAINMGAVQHIGTRVSPRHTEGGTGPKVIQSAAAKRVTYSLVASHSVGADGNIAASSKTLATKAVTIHYSNSSKPSNKEVVAAFKSTVANYKSNYDDFLKRYCKKTAVKIVDRTSSVAIPAR